MPSAEAIVRANGVDLCVQTFGRPDDPPVLLVMGIGASMLWWEDGFCERLAAGRRFVVRYDQRDTGRSVSYEPGAPGYTADDLVGDAVGLLDALDLERAHLVGMSMGGMIAQLAALDHGERVASLTLISTSPGGRAGDPSGAGEEPERPPPGDSGPDWADRAAAIEAILADCRALAGPAHPFDETATRGLVTRDVDRTVNIASAMTNHPIALGSTGPWRERLGGLDVPTLVLHGTADPVFPLDEALALADEIPGARLVSLEGVGHEVPAPIWDEVVSAILRHTDTPMVG